MKANEFDLEHAELEVPRGRVEISSKLLAHGFTDQENGHHRHMEGGGSLMGMRLPTEQKEGLRRKPEEQ